ncbi:hypothetical protein Ga0466249_001836 [Sporomusaceae bacterium BoRhaA]|nr:hypothetical protein [Pelorhabdus rhamnosifermentans]
MFYEEVYCAQCCFSVYTQDFCRCGYYRLAWQQLGAFGKKPLILIGSGSIRRNGTLERIKAIVGSDYTLLENIPMRCCCLLF